MYQLKFTEKADEGVRRLKKTGDVQVLKKLAVLLSELTIHPTYGTGKPERLKGNLSGKWSRRINDRHRLIYEIFEQIVTVEIIQVYGHYSES